MRAWEFIAEAREIDPGRLAYGPAEKEPWLTNPAMAQARENKESYTDAEGRHWDFRMNNNGWREYAGLREPKNIPGVNISEPLDMVGQRVYHCTNKLAQIEKSGKLKPKPDELGAREYGRLTTHQDPFIPIIGVWVMPEGREKWAGKNCVSFVIEPTDTVVKPLYGQGLVVLNPIPLTRLQIDDEDKQ